MSPKKDVCELLIHDAEEFVRSEESASRKKVLFLSLFAISGMALAVYAMIDQPHQLG